MADLHSTAENPEVHHETSDINFRGVLAFGAGLIVAAIAIHFGIWLLFHFFQAREAQKAALEYPLAAGQQNRLPPEPRLQPSPPGWSTPREDLQKLRAEEDEILRSYGWVDKNAGIVRIPINEAMKLTVKKGLPVRTDRGERK